MLRDAWWDHAACNGVDPDIFFPVSERSNSRRMMRAPERRVYAEAARVCASCPVQRQCLEDVLRMPPTEEGDFFAAGLFPSQIRKLRQRRLEQATADTSQVIGG